MINYNISNFKKKIILFLVDFIIVILSVSLAYTLRLEKFYPFWKIEIIVYIIFFVIFFLTFYVNNVYQILIRYFDYHSIKNIIKSIIYFQIVLILINFLVYKNIYFPRSVSFIAPIFIGIFVILIRVIISFLINSNNIKNNLINNILIIGINDQTVNLFNNIRQSNDYGNVKCFLDISGEYKKREINGVKIYKIRDLYKIIKTLNINEIIIGTKSFKKNERVSLFKKLENQNIRIKNLANIKEGHRNLIKKSLKIKPNFYDIIDREKIIVDKKVLIKKIKSKSILITGAGGSIGSELTKEIAKHSPKRIYALDNSEINLFNLLSSLKDHKIKNIGKIIPVLGDCGDIEFLDSKFKNKNLDEVFHAAAYKHVFFGEENPYSMIKNNIFGTKNIIKFAIQKRIKNFTFISSDKAVNPKSILGFSKKYGERLIEYYYKKNKLGDIVNFTIVRFGNVIGSSGSVIPIFLNQISKGEPLTVTNKKAQRYFMSISEAVKLVINSSFLNKKGVKIYALNMGQQINIYEIAKRIIRLSGNTVKNKKNINGDVEIKIIGLKKGEKISEEIALGKNLKSTSHSRIMQCDEKIDIKNLETDLIKINKFLNNKFFLKKILTLVK
ncbi:polysaccharide biosynthesis protein [Candidatus Pelagibacter bacterium nBUS_44]|uniref:polysaccharide biosynthesis protein n=1 Tax=Candidatus Pelagibacter bacterium nBUS_44 TaxID=3374195 RepID=UPI003EB846B7